MIDKDFLLYFSTCTVGILAGRDPASRDLAGTGFFVAPGKILTCAHVVATLGKGVNLRWNKATLYGTVEKLGNPESLLVRAKPGDSTDPDLALITLEDASFGPELRHPCVLLSDEIPDLNEKMYSYGHAAGEYAENGEALTLEYEGPAQDLAGRDMLKFKKGNVLPGMSGAPLMNQRTGAVCGVLFVSRDVSSDLGGRGIPIALAYGMFPGLREAHEAYHQRNARWVVLWSGYEPLVETPTKGVPAATKAAVNEFKQRKNSFGVWAEKLQIEKLPDLVGNSSVRYRVENLQTSNSTLSGISIYVESAIGIVGIPSPEKDSEDLIEWVPESNSRNEPAPLDQKIKEVRRIQGKFKFKRQLKEGDKITFGWSIEILNQYALSDWEFNNLYGDQAVDFDHSPLTRAVEYFPQIVWFPIETLHVHLALPPQLRTVPALSVFACSKRQQIKAENIVQNGYLETHPPRGSVLMPAPNQEWDRDPVELKRRLEGLRPDSNGLARFNLVVPYPPIGFCYSLSWELPVTFTQLVRDSEKMRTRLRRDYRPWRRNPAGTDDTHRSIEGTFHDLAEGLRLKYATEGSEIFEVTLMTYDDESRNLVVVDGLRNGAELRPEDWSFELPFGTGLAGACFREGNQAIAWLRKEKDARFGYYLPVSEKEVHQALLLIPIDHPGLLLATDLPEVEEKLGGFSQRAQQVIGLIVVTSDAEDTGLLRLSTRQEAQNNAPISGPISELAKIVDDVCGLGFVIARAYGLWS